MRFFKCMLFSIYSFFSIKTAVCYKTEKYLINPIDLISLFIDVTRFFAIISLMYHLLSSRIGLSGFDNPMRDSKTDEFKQQVGQVILFYFYYFIER